MVFFSPNKNTALKHLKQIGIHEDYYRGKKPVLAKKQVPHISGWKTWDMK